MEIWILKDRYGILEGVFKSKVGALNFVKEDYDKINKVYSSYFQLLDSKSKGFGFSGMVYELFREELRE